MTADDTLAIALAVAATLVLVGLIQAVARWERRQQQRDRDRIAMAETIRRTGGPRP